MKVFLLGGYGLLGSDIYLSFVKAGFEVYRFPKEKVNLLDISTLNIINDLNPDVIVHAAGYTNVEKSELNITNAIELNCKGMYNLLRILKDQDIPILYFSTDYVFDGQNNEAYKEEDKALPINNYGLSKLMSEDILRANYKNYYIIRTSWLFGEHGNCFPKVILDKCKNQQKLDVVSDQIGSPTYTKDLAETVKQIIIKKIPFGTYHVTNDGETTWYEFALEILKNSKVNLFEINKILTEDLLSNTKRPKYSVLSNEKIKSYGIVNRSYESASKEFLNNIME